MTLTNKFKKRYIPGYDCRLSTFRNSLAVNDIILSNSMILGLSGCLIFCFNDGKFYSRIPGFAIAGINDQSLESLAFNLNIYLMRGRMHNIKEAKRQISSYLSMQIPINIAINRKAFQNIFNLNLNQLNMGHHYVTITEYDEVKDIVTIFETDTVNEFSLSIDQLEHIWFYDIKSKRNNIDPFQLCDGTWYSFLCKKQTSEELINACYNGIYKVIINFFNSPIPAIYGQSALIKFKDTVYLWENGIENENDFKKSIKLMNAMESGMSGGGLGRKLYSYFLSELSSYINDATLKEISYKFLDLAKLWKSFVNNLTLYSEDTSNNINIEFYTIKEQIDTIVEYEISCMKNLREWHINKN